MRAIGYFRITVDKSHTVEEFEDLFKEFCSLNLHQPLKTFCSKGIKSPPDDLEYRSMCEFLKEMGGQYLVLVPTAAHLGNNLESVARVWLELESFGASVGCSNEEFPNLMQNAFQTLGIKGVSKTRSLRIKESMRSRSLKGQALGRPPYGYNIGPGGNFEIHQVEAKVVELVFRLYTRDGIGLRLITQHLNDREIRTRRGRSWNVATIRDILKNPVYTGTYTRFDIRRPKTHKAIISQDIFRDAQDQTRKRRPMGRVINPKPFLLSGIIYCHYCGNKMMGVTRRQTWKRKDGKRTRGVYRYYQCQSRNNQSRCGYHTWRAARLERTVIGQLKYVLMTQTDKQDNWENTALYRAEEIRSEQLRNAERRFLAAMKRAARGDIGPDVLVEYIQELDDVRNSKKTVLGDNMIEQTFKDWDSLDFEARKLFLNQSVSKVDVLDEDVHISL